jgi:uncharacterized protein (TIGR00251 family)
MRLLRPPIASTQDGILITVHVIPNVSQTGILLEHDGGITMRVNAPPVKGKANREIVKWLSKKLGTPSSRIRIVAGLTSSLKVIAIIGMNENGFLEAIRQKPKAVS